MEKDVMTELGTISTLIAALGFEGMHTDRELPPVIRLFYSLVLLVGLTLVVTATVITSFCNKPFSDAKIADAARVSVSVYASSSQIGRDNA